MLSPARTQTPFIRWCLCAGRVSSAAILIEELMQRRLWIAVAGKAAWLEGKADRWATFFSWPPLIVHEACMAVAPFSRT